MMATQRDYPDTSIVNLLSTGLPNFRLHIVQRYKTIPIDFAIDKKRDTASFLVYDAQGYLLLNHSILEVFTPPRYVYRWNLRDGKNQMVPSGTYFFALTFEDGSPGKASGTIVHIPGDSTSLLVAAERGEMNILKQLLENGAGIYVNVKDHRGRTPLMIAAKEGFMQSAQVLISVGADIYAQDLHGYTALAYASRGHNEEMIQLIRETMVNRQIRH